MREWVSNDEMQECQHFGHVMIFLILKYNCHLNNTPLHPFVELEASSA